MYLINELGTFAIYLEFFSTFDAFFEVKWNNFPKYSQVQLFIVRKQNY
jgi:hypothetical protein